MHTAVVTYYCYAPSIYFTYCVITYCSGCWQIWVSSYGMYRIGGGKVSSHKPGLTASTLESIIFITYNTSSPNGI